MSQPNAEKPAERFVFQDRKGKRWPRLRRMIVAWSALTACGLIWFIWSLLVRPEFHMASSIRQLKGKMHAAIKESDQMPNDIKAVKWQEIQQRAAQAKGKITDLDVNRAAAHKARPAGNEIRLGLYVDWDPNAFTSLEEHASSLTHLAPEWFTIGGVDGKMTFTPEPRVTSFATSHGINLMPLLSNLQGDEWHPEPIENLAHASQTKRAPFINDLVSKLKQTKASGVILDWEELDPAYTDEYTDLIVQMAEALHNADLEIWLMVSPGEDFETLDLTSLQLTVDHFVAMLIDEHGENDPAGPLASLTWLDGWLKAMQEFGEPDQWVAVLGAYAYDWNITNKKGESISFKDAMSRASYAGVDKASTPSPSIAAPVYAGLYSYFEPTGEHTVSFLDAISFYDQLREIRAGKLAGIGIFRLGAEDPQIWDVLEMRGAGRSSVLSPAQVKPLEDLRATDTITHVGRGEVVTVEMARKDGRREVHLETDGKLTAHYLAFPTFPTLYHEGAGSEHQVAITFDDGPDPVWTPKILEILKRRGVKACFFLVGMNAEAYPGLVARILAEGHEIGNHTYSHANLATMSPWRMKMELNTTQRVIESVTGRSTTLFRPPYNADTNPASLADLAPLALAQDQLDYTIVLESIDPQDWARPGADVIVQRVKDQRNNGNIVLLHDAGGDRSQTVEALPKIIDYLRTRGDHIISLGQLLDLDRDDLMPPITSHDGSVERIVSGTGLRIWRAVVEGSWSFMIFATGLVIVRTLMVAWLAHRNHRKAEQRPKPTGGAFQPAVSVVIAAFNEGKVIEKTLRAVTGGDYPGELEFIIVDDGSRDNTAAKVEEFAREDPRVRLLRQPNRGKALALRNGVLHAKNPIIVFLDADTLFEKGTIRALIEPFVDPHIGAVSGNARVGNLRSFVAWCQALEYICGFNLDRRAYTEWNCITVVPGAVSALRRTAIDAAGGFSDQTLAEDTDLTLTLHRLRYRMDFAADAVAWTEAPETFRTLAKQRFRWAFGTMQCLWKHRDMVFNPRFGALGWFSLPSIWFFQIALVALAPFVDAVLLWSVFFGHSEGIRFYFIIFVALDFALANLACWMEGEPLRLAFLSLPMRLAYRPMLAYVIWRSIFRAFKGALVGWGKLERTASVPTRT